MNTTNLEQKRQRIETAVKILALVVVGFFVAPFIFIAIKGLVGVLVAGTVGLAAVNLAPSVAAHIANWRLKALKAVAAANPIETLENQYAQRKDALVKIRENIQQSYAVLTNLQTQIKEYEQTYPGRQSQYKDKAEKLRALFRCFPKVALYLIPSLPFVVSRRLSSATDCGSALLGSFANSLAVSEPGSLTDPSAK